LNEHIAETVIKELILEEVPDINYVQTGGLAGLPLHPR
jgi:hypothetical protein